MQNVAKYREANPELVKMINRLQDIKRGKIQNAYGEIPALEESIAAMRKKNEAAGKPRGRPPNIEGAKVRSDKGKPRGPPINPPKKK